MARFNWGSNITASLPNVNGQAPYADTIWCNDYSLNVNPDEANWTHAVVRVNRNVSVTVPPQAIMHEVGHVLGLKHRNEQPNSIMCQESFNRTAKEPSDFDRALVALKYINNK